MEFWNKVQKPVALISGAILVILIIAIVGREFLPQLGSYFQSTTDQKQDQSKSDPDKSSDKKAASDNGSPSKPQQTPSQATKDNYHYTAAAGDSYTLFARRAISSYAKAHNISLSAADALTAEVVLANSAGSPELEIGQKVTITSQKLSSVLPNTNSEQSKVSSEKDDNKSKTSPSTADYTYTAAAGDTYSWLARKAISSYMSSASIDLSGAQRLAAEAHLAEKAGSPLLEIGQTVTLSASDVKTAVAAAHKLTISQQGPWQVYVSSADL